MSQKIRTRRASKFDGEQRGEQWTKTARTAFIAKFKRFTKWLHVGR